MMGYFVANANAIVTRIQDGENDKYSADDSAASKQAMNLTMKTRIVQLLTVLFPCSVYLYYVLT